MKKGKKNWKVFMMLEIKLQIAFKDTSCHGARMSQDWRVFILQHIRTDDRVVEEKQTKLRKFTRMIVS